MDKQKEKKKGQYQIKKRYEKNWKKSRKYEIIKDKKPVMCRNPGFPLGVPAHVG